MNNNSEKSKWVLVVKGLESKPEIKTQLDNFKKEGYELRWLTDGFPLLEDSISVSSPKLYWQVLEQLKSKEFSDAIVISENRVSGFAGKRPILPSNVRWISVPSEKTDYTLNATSAADSAIVRTGYTSAEETFFISETHPATSLNQSVKLNPMDTIRIVIVADNSHRYDKKIIEAALYATRISFPVKMEIINISPDKINSAGNSDWIIWLTDLAIPKPPSASLIYTKPDLNPEIFVQEKINKWVITKRLNEEIALNENITVQLASILLPTSKIYETARQHDRRMLSDKIAWGDGDAPETGKAHLLQQSAESYLLVWLLITLLVERMLSYYRNQ
jgi:hypothetical protein